MSDPTQYSPEPDCLADRVLRLLARNPEEDYTTADLALKFSVHANGISTRLATAIGHGLCVYAVGDGPGKTWKAGPNLAAWWAARNDAKAPPQQAPKAPRAYAPPLDPLTVPIVSGLAIPPATVGPRAVNPYKALYERMKPGDCVKLPDSRAHSFAKWAKKAELSVTLRRVDVGVKGVWRNA